MDCKSTHFFVKYTTSLKKIDFQGYRTDRKGFYPEQQIPAMRYQQVEMVPDKKSTHLNGRI